MHQPMTSDSPPLRRARSPRTVHRVALVASAALAVGGNLACGSGNATGVGLGETTQPSHVAAGGASSPCPAGSTWDGKGCTQGAAAATTATQAPIAANTAPVTCPVEMRLIAGGTFTMGSSDGDEDEKPAHVVAVSSFCLDITEVTVEAYEACVAAKKCAAPPKPDPNDKVMNAWCNAGKAGRGKHPMNCVMWFDADAYCRALGKRLPAEEEWEYAAKGGAENRRYPWGDAAPGPTLLNGCGAECVPEGKRATGADWTANYPGNDGHVTTAPVGSFPAGNSRDGIQDLAGNVWEWTASARCSYPSKSCPDVRERVYRGGAWFVFVPEAMRAANRGAVSPDAASGNVGFRCAK